MQTDANSITSRRGVLGEIAGALTLAGAGGHATAQAAVEDPHLALERRLRTVENGYTPSGDDDDARQAGQFALEDRIAETPAHTLAGVMVQLRLALSYVEIGNGTVSDCDVNAIRNALATLERLAGRA